MKYITNIYLLLVLLFLYEQIFDLVVFSFNDSKSMAHWGGFTFKWYKSLLHNESIMSALYYTLLVAILSSVIATKKGTKSANGINKMKTKPTK